MALGQGSYLFIVGCVHICPQARQLNHWIVPTASPPSRSLLPQLLQNCCGGGRRAGCGAEVVGESIRRTDYAGNYRLNDVLFRTRLTKSLKGREACHLDFTFSGSRSSRSVDRRRLLES
jgi:hypothetical protein